MHQKRYFVTAKNSPRQKSLLNQLAKFKYLYRKDNLKIQIVPRSLDTTALQCSHKAKSHLLMQITHWRLSNHPLWWSEF